MTAYLIVVWNGGEWTDSNGVKWAGWAPLGYPDVSSARLYANYTDANAAAERYAQRRMDGGDEPRVQVVPVDLRQAIAVSGEPNAGG